MIKNTILYFATIQEDQNIIKSKSLVLDASLNQTPETSYPHYVPLSKKETTPNTKLLIDMKSKSPLNVEMYIDKITSIHPKQDRVL